MVKVLGYSLWILDKVLLALRHQVRQSLKVSVHLMANLSLVVRTTAPDVEREFTQLKRNWLQDGYVLSVLTTGFDLCIERYRCVKSVLRIGFALNNGGGAPDKNIAKISHLSNFSDIKLWGRLYERWISFARFVRESIAFSFYRTENLRRYFPVQTEQTRLISP